MNIEDLKPGHLVHYTYREMGSALVIYRHHSLFDFTKCYYFVNGKICWGWFFNAYLIPGYYYNEETYRRWMK